MTDSEDDLAAVAALGEPTRRRVYTVVADSIEPLTRDRVADILRLPRTTAAFHLERLAGEGLLEVTYARRSGRSGPGAGRPAKFYRRSSREVTVSIPPRHYDLAARVLLNAIEESSCAGTSVAVALERHARRVGAELGQALPGSSAEDALSQCGFKPRHDEDGIVLANCPFRTLAAEFTTTVCGMNLHLINGLLAGVDAPDWSTRLDPAPDLCCVRLERAA